MNSHFDIAVLGAGPGGYVAALKAGQMGAKVAVIEKGELGGTCLNSGCVPSKALLASAELVHRIDRASEMGVDLSGAVSVNWAKIQDRKDRIIQTLRGGIKGLFDARKVAFHQGQAVLNGRGRINISTPYNLSEEITADKVILAVGSVAARIPGWPTDPRVVSTGDQALHWATLPKRLLIVGGGSIGCEFACMLQALGVKVTIVEMLPRLLPNTEGDVAEALAKVLKSRGVDIFTGVKIEDLTVGEHAVTATLADRTTITADRVLVAVGRKPNTAEVGLQSVGIATERGFVRVNDRMETPIPGYYCIGDANGRCLLAHAASAQGIAAVENALGHGRDFVAPIPNCIYTFPEVASAGLTTEECKSRSLPISTGTFPLAHLGKAMAVNDTEGFVKVIRHRETDALLGVHMIGHNVTECIAAAGALLHQNVKVRDVAETVFAHPTISEALKEAADGALSMGLHLAPRKVIRLAAAV